ncbi:hypothetical protein PV939_06065 [Ligilactobacillus salivarius]|uniref:hypothetical protein n=1 Tax=Ligilactobacillus salivarius TaxID=1624 RepID=UPI003992B624|nr:hypothetical protein [Ligilactobacillus salivarius]
MNNIQFISILLDCGSYDLSRFFTKLDKYEDTVFRDDADFSYRKLIENVKDNYNDYNIESLNEGLDIMALQSAFDQVDSSDEFEELVWDGFKYGSNNEFWFDNEEKLKKAEEWEEFSALLKL